MNNFKLHILAAERSFYVGDCQSLVVPITDGRYGVQANHRNMVAAVVPGILEFTDGNGERIKANVSQGILIVNENDVNLLVDYVETDEEKEASLLKRAKDDEIEAKLQKKSIQEFKSAQLWIAKENNSLKRKSRRYDDRL